MTDMYNKSAFTPYDYKAKIKNVNQLNRYMLAKTITMFNWVGLPETIPYRELELLLQKHGYAFITEVNGALYALWGSLGGTPDEYYNPTTITCANPALKLSKTFDLNKDGVLIKNDDLLMGFLPLFTKQNTMLMENEINMMVWGYNSRTLKLISAPDDKTKESAEQYLKKIVDGDISVIGENALFDGVKLQSSNTGSAVTIQQMIEFQQYVKASMYNEIGLSANFNMKRERLISSELDQSEDSLFPLVYAAMKCRMKAVEQINAMFNLNVSIDFGSVWHFKNKEIVSDLPGATPDEAAPNQPGDVPADVPADVPGDSPADVPADVPADDTPVNDDTQIDDDNGDGERGQAPDSETDSGEGQQEEEGEGQQVQIEVTINDDNSDSSDEEVNNDPVDNLTPELRAEVEELKNIIENEDSTEEEKELALARIKEIESGENNGDE